MSARESAFNFLIVSRSLSVSVREWSWRLRLLERGSMARDGAPPWEPGRAGRIATLLRDVAVLGRKNSLTLPHVSHGMAHSRIGSITAARCCCVTDLPSAAVGSDVMLNFSLPQTSQL